MIFQSLNRPSPETRMESPEVKHLVLICAKLLWKCGGLTLSRVLDVGCRWSFRSQGVWLWKGRHLSGLQDCGRRVITIRGQIRLILACTLICCPVPCVPSITDRWSSLEDVTAPAIQICPSGVWSDDDADDHRPVPRSVLELGESCADVSNFARC